MTRNKQPRQQLPHMCTYKCMLQTFLLLTEIRLPSCNCKTSLSPKRRTERNTLWTNFQDLYHSFCCNNCSISNFLSQFCFTLEKLMKYDQQVLSYTVHNRQSLPCRCQTTETTNCNCPQRLEESSPQPSKLSEVLAQRTRVEETPGFFLISVNELSLKKKHVLRTLQAGVWNCSTAQRSDLSVDSNGNATPLCSFSHVSMLMTEY